MPEYCTCGAQLVENARFCHRCGRPTFEAPPEKPTPVISLPVQPTLHEKIAQLPVSFRNPIALRIAFLMSLGITLVQMVPFLGLLCFVWWTAAGWCAVLLYRRMTGLSLSVPAGARLGSITGVLAFVSMAAMIALRMFFEGKELVAQMVKQDPRISEVVNDPQMFAMAMLMLLGICFALVVGFCATGGALGARRLSRKTG